jgi:hypothetical protein
MFTKPNELSAESPRETNGAGHRDATPSILSADLKVVGNLECAGDVQVEGRIEGDIRSQSVTVGEGADVRGSIFAERVRIGGTVQGEISAPVIVIAKSAKVRPPGHQGRHRRHRCGASSRETRQARPAEDRRDPARKGRASGGQVGGALTPTDGRRPKPRRSTEPAPVL